MRFGNSRMKREGGGWMSEWLPKLPSGQVPPHASPLGLTHRQRDVLTSSLSVSSLCICSSCRFLSWFLSMPCPLGSLTPDPSAEFWAGAVAAVRPSLGLSWGCSPGSEARSPAASSSSSSSSASFSSAGPSGKELRAATARRIATSAAAGSQAQQALFSLAGVEARLPGPGRRRADLARAEPSAVRLAGPRQAAGWRSPGGGWQPCQLAAPLRRSRAQGVGVWWGGGGDKG